MNSLKMCKTAVYEGADYLYSQVLPDNMLEKVEKINNWIAVEITNCNLLDVVALAF